ncbi:nucleotide exchange factor GrpE [Dermabacter vaginalis]|uniref:nucleotide exchange factor GrpE n=1 Tax=Dermabacter vaginalis TaxID=1630135 RepID=UPI0021A8ECB2|nr:nucleotide exchange factor GrpE [Dermabacter vaginalis]MCT2149037.1 nucleotide exchange factor GrpE [Dermabacter vaginalis]
MSEHDKPFTFTDKRTSTKGEEPDMNEQPTDGAPEETLAPAEANANSTDTPEGTEVDDLSAEAGALYESAVAETEALKAKVNELEEQLKRDQAEYVNSRRRIEQSAVVGQQQAVAKVLTSLLSVLDDIELARQHGDIAEGSPFASITSKLEEALGAHGLTRFGEKGEEFDPEKHEALMHSSSDEAEATSLEVIMQPGYMMGERVLRPARVGTVGPN